jgi:Mycobacterium membrane protein
MKVTIGFQLGQRARRRPIPLNHISTIGTIRHTLIDGVGPVSGPVQDYPDDESYDGADIDDGYGELAWASEGRWRPFAAILGAVVALGAVATAVIINSGDSASTKATVGAPAPLTSAPSTSKTTAPPSAPSSSPSPSQAPQLPPETVTTVTPPSPLPGMGPTRTPTAAPVPTAAPPPVAVNPRTVVYTVTGSKQLLDLVNVVYTDARGYPQTEFNVSLPWSKVIVLNPGVQTESVVATSFYSRLNCSVVNAAGQPVLASTNNGNMATCTR